MICSLIGCIQTGKNISKLITHIVKISCKCNAISGCYWEPSVNNFHCIPRGQCANIRQLVWTEITENSVRYRKNNNDPIGIPISAQPSSKILMIKFPYKVNFDLVTFSVWNGAVRQTYCDKGLTLLELEVDDPNVLLEISYDKNRYKAKDFNDRKFINFIIHCYTCWRWPHLTTMPN